VKWLVTSADHIVHASHCALAKDEKTAPYFPQRILRDSDGKPRLDTIHDYTQMAEHLMRPDSSGGMMSHHEGATMLKPCEFCVPNENVS
jgi:hypothetical protein